ncbi:MAG: hypothetical protein A3G25_07510 [Betaproteobacteria bacterium RIFCSPLOWO2_12_FULL_63_13]|nr:MAG: hypothetical protein A3G25_07510 [Betaproteobacteria bacterium RIFCSPLOWO2_12_FULL_63_13]
MRLNVIALSLTSGLVWGGAILIVATANAIWPNYGRAFLELAAAIYPGYQPAASIGAIVTGTLYALVDGAIGGAVFAWLYNLLARRFAGASA